MADRSSQPLELKPVSLNLDATSWREFQRLCRKHKVSPSSVIREFIFGKINYWKVFDQIDLKERDVDAER